MNSSTKPALLRSAAYLCTRINAHAASTLRNPASTDVALHLHGEEVTPLAEGGYGVVPVSFATVLLTPDQARAMAQSLLAAADISGGAAATPVSTPPPPAPSPKARASQRHFGKPRGPLEKAAG